MGFFSTRPLANVVAREEDLFLPVSVDAGLLECVCVGGCFLFTWNRSLLLPISNLVRPVVRAVC